MQVERGSIPHTVLVYTVSEPGDWTIKTIVEDLPDASPESIQSATNELFHAGYIHINSSDHRLWPRRAGKAMIRP
ncbi:MAG: hypothetical protein ACI8RZ_002659 [Myxococcota bacterium]|jgi:hypothetical protein